ncbi:MAG: hypothetical protein ACP5D7_10275 [Limnospira sp.]
MASGGIPWRKEAIAIAIDRKTDTQKLRRGNPPTRLQSTQN